MAVLCRRTQGTVRKFNLTQELEKDCPNLAQKWKHKGGVGLSQVKICSRESKQKEPPKREEFVVPRGGS